MAGLLLHHQLTKALQDENSFKDTFGEYRLALKYIKRGKFILLVFFLNESIVILGILSILKV